MNLSWELDGWIIAAGILSAVSAALLGNFLILRKMSLLGDAIGHAVLPGLAAAFFISDSRSSIPMFIGAVIVGLLTAFFTEWIRGVGKVDEGASMGVVFTSLFALGLVMIVQAADHVDLDPGCVLYGAIESTPLDTWQIGSLFVPRVVVVLGVVTCINLLFVVLFFKELKISAFDPSLSTTCGFPAWLMHYLLMMLVAVTAVASFESVGNILVVAMLVVPPAAAYMLTDRLGIMIALSTVIGAISAVLGHFSALIVPGWFGFRSTTTAGMIAVMIGILFALAALFSPKHGIVFRMLRRQSLSWRILREDIIALLYRVDEKNGDQPVENGADRKAIREALLASSFSISIALRWLRLKGLIVVEGSVARLTSLGRSQAEQLVRSHRLWETYMHSEAGLAADRIHTTAERLEHYTGMELGQRLSAETSGVDVDPHGSRIPGGESQP